MDAIHALNDASMENLNKKMAEYAQAVCQDRPTFHVSLIVDVSPFCDCHAENDAPIVPNIGMLASFDPVAISTTPLLNPSGRAVWSMLKRLDWVLAPTSSSK